MCSKLTIHFSFRSIIFIHLIKLKVKCTNVTHSCWHNVPDSLPADIVRCWGILTSPSTSSWSVLKTSSSSTTASSSSTAGLVGLFWLLKVMIVAPLMTYSDLFRDLGAALLMTSERLLWCPWSKIKEKQLQQWQPARASEHFYTDGHLMPGPERTLTINSHFIIWLLNNS